jgi:hypothetical protein
MRFGLTTLILFLALALPAIAAEPNMNEGKWEITTVMEMPGMPIAIPPVKYTHCLTKKDAVPQQAEKNQDCKMISTDIQGDTVFWIMECKNQNEVVRSQGNITYRKDSFDGNINMTTTSGGQKSGSMKSKISGRRLGACQ